MTSPGQANSRWMTLAIVVACLAAAAVFFLLGRQGAGPVDDDYIVYRYARHWLEDGRLVYNLAGPGSTPIDSEGYTSPLWLVCCVVAEAMAIMPERFSPALGLLGWLVATVSSGLAVGALGEGEERGGARFFAGVTAALMVAFSPAAAWHSHAGLGTLPLAGAVGGALWAASKRQTSVFALASAAAVLLRLESLAVLVPLALLFRRGAEENGAARGSAAAWIAAFVPFAAALVVVGVRNWAFGRWLPATFHVKTLPLA
ncbi:MAG: hypothetical protein AAGG01_07345, partial [Planctomycetota bacterium]